LREREREILLLEKEYREREREKWVGKWGLNGKKMGALVGLKVGVE
jgi:hypothetical protein